MEVHTGLRRQPRGRVSLLARRPGGGALGLARRRLGRQPPCPSRPVERNKQVFDFDSRLCVPAEPIFVIISA